MHKCPHINVFEMQGRMGDDIPFPSTLRKLWGVGNLNFFRMININKMAAIFQFFS